MTAKLKHIALVSDNYALQGKFYEAAFGMRTAADPRPERAVTVGDGYVGLNINPRKPGRAAGLDHFGLEVDEVAPILERLKKQRVEVVQRPST
ncbi:MAG TPA: VOC family protein, partial [Burkholderiales bacterium]|nr:VOC family protein [Burkholderiales bacterium]